MVSVLASSAIDRGFVVAIDRGFVIAIDRGFVVPIGSN
jgi:hypothetical protein